MFRRFAEMFRPAPVSVRFTADAWRFSRGDKEVAVRPVVWLDRIDESARVLGLGDAHLPNATAVDLFGASIQTLSAESRVSLLATLLRFGLGQLGIMLRPSIVFHEAVRLAAVVGDEYRRVLTTAAKASGASSVRFEE